MIRPALSLAAVLSAGAALAAQPVTLRSAPVDADGSVTLGELFEGTSSQVVVGRAAPGAGLVLESARVQAVARAAGLAWSNPAGVRRIVVRAAVPETPSSKPAATQAGAAEALTYVRSLNAGAVVAAEDLAWAPVPRTPSDAPGDAEAAIGLALKKPVRAGSPVSARDLTAARVIARGDVVSVHYRAGRISLALQGKALTAAAIGEPIRIQNTQSKTVVEAVAAGPGLAVVGPQAEALRTRAAALALR